MATRVRSFCKINLGLAVGHARAEGFHGLTTCYQTLEAHDLVTVTETPAPATAITLTANHPGVPRTETSDAEKNTAFRMVEEALKLFGISAEVRIDLDKRLPVQGGLGAGSANAAAALLALEAEVKQSLSWPQRLQLAAEIGSDVPLFLLGGTVLGLSRGEDVYPLPDIPSTPCVLAIPDVGVSTRQAFADLDAKMTAAAHPEAGGRAASSLTSSPTVDKLKQLSHVLAGSFSHPFAEYGAEPGLSGIAGRTSDLAENPLLTLVRTGIENDFEEVAFSQHPSLRSTKRDLVGSEPNGALFAGLSGSGSALFGLYRSDADAIAAQRRVQLSGTRTVLTRTLSRPEYWSAMFERT